MKRFFDNRSQESNGGLNNEIKGTFKVIKEEFEAHLDTINENTAEIQANYEFMQRLDSKIDKLNERLDNIQMFLRGLAHVDKGLTSTETIDIQPLSSQEKRVFLVIYTSADQPMSYADIANKINVPESLVSGYITSMVEKGIPFLREYKDKKALHYLGKGFRDKQAKHNVVKISQRTLQV